MSKRPNRVEIIYLDNPHQTEHWPLEGAKINFDGLENWTPREGSKKLCGINKRILAKAYYSLKPRM